MHDTTRRIIKDNHDSSRSSASSSTRQVQVVAVVAVVAAVRGGARSVARDAAIASANDDEDVDDSIAF